MKHQIGIFANDQINLAGTCIPASSLMKGHVEQVTKQHSTGQTIGSPSHIQHDMHRPIGWSKVIGHFIDGSMVRVIGYMQIAETDQEKTALNTLTSRYWETHHEEGMQQYREELLRNVGPIEIENPRYMRIESYVISHPDLAATLYPELFDEAKDLVDKDGLTDYRALRKRAAEIQPGIFHDPARDLLIFSHRYFRRSLSHRNKLNEYFLTSFNRAAEELDKVATARLRLDRDLIGHSATLKHLIELEHWHGPIFNDDIQSIPNGVSEHKASERARYFEGIDKTHFWWKHPETRSDGSHISEYRTFEVEELIENPSGGLPEDQFGCRYAHAEYSQEFSAVTHFDGAIRAYPAQDYLERIEKAIDRAGKRSIYTKLFRFDGTIPIHTWKRLLSDFFRGNPLIPEYLSGNRETTSSKADYPAENVDRLPDQLCAFISLSPGSIPHRISIEPTIATLPGGYEIEIVQTGCGAIDKFIRQRLDISDITSVGLTDGTLNLARMAFGKSSDFPNSLHQTVGDLTLALKEDIKSGIASRVATSFSWQLEDLVLTLSIRGRADLVEQVLPQLFNVVDATKSPAVWIEDLSALIRDLAPRGIPSDNLTGVMDGSISFEPSEEALTRMHIPDMVLQDLFQKGVLSKGENQ